MAGCFDDAKPEEKLDLEKAVGHGGASGDHRTAFLGLFRSRAFLMSSMQAQPEREDFLFAPAVQPKVRKRGVRKVA
jgi:hypothetical protein